MAQNVNSTDFGNLALAYLMRLLWDQWAFPHLRSHKITYEAQVGPPWRLHTVISSGCWGWEEVEGGLSEGSARTLGSLDISVENFRFSSDALIIALSRHKNRLANLGTELNNLRNNLNI